MDLLNRLFLLLMLCFGCTLFSNAQAQEIAFQTKITNAEIQDFKSELEFKYRLFFESVLNIIDNDNNIFSRRNAYYLINTLFDNEDANISDYLDNQYPETLSLKDYGQRLFLLENVLPLLDKRYKFSDSIYISPGVMDIRNNYNHLSKSEQKEKLFRVYDGEVFFIEEIISVQKVRKDIFDAIDRNVVKKLSFKISHDEEDDYQLFITSISILDPRNRAYDYKKIKEEIRTSSKPWSDRADPDYLKKIEDEAQRRGITLVGDADKIADQLAYDKSRWYYDAPNVLDYIIPGYGHLRFGSDKVRVRDALIHSTSTLGSLGFAIHYHRKSNQYQSMYLSQASNENAIKYLEKSKTYQRRSNILKVVTAASHAVGLIHLIAKDNKQKRLIDKVLGSSDVSYDYTPLGPVTNYSISLVF